MSCFRRRPPWTPPAAASYHRPQPTPPAACQPPLEASAALRRRPEPPPRRGSNRAEPDPTGPDRRRGSPPRPPQTPTGLGSLVARPPPSAGPEGKVTTTSTGWTRAGSSSFPTGSPTWPLQRPPKGHRPRRAAAGPARVSIPSRVDPADPTRSSRPPPNPNPKVELWDLEGYSSISFETPFWGLQLAKAGSRDGQPRGTCCQGGSSF
ncbi:proline-rich proteoglycan 2-like [Ananas comosus]|uniref:Proline-rich proteoglycan 2-like n=1 Tax=Ananas comosus TaxID=4615 RepID=A0A6P5EN65_ANACO|nr:proline-rich proteoglycan 2-like [Ananas comosus]